MGSVHCPKGELPALPAEARVPFELSGEVCIVLFARTSEFLESILPRSWKCEDAILEDVADRTRTRYNLPNCDILVELTQHL